MNWLQFFGGRSHIATLSIASFDKIRDRSFVDRRRTRDLLILRKYLVILNQVFGSGSSQYCSLNVTEIQESLSVSVSELNRASFARETVISGHAKALESLAEVLESISLKAETTKSMLVRLRVNQLEA